jgi:hypothetical protein
MSKLYGNSLRDTLGDPIVREVFETITVLTTEDIPDKDCDDKVSFQELNDELSKMKESEVLRSVRILEKTPLLEEEVNVDFSEPNNTRTFYTVSDLPEDMEEQLSLILEDVNRDIGEL